MSAVPAALNLEIPYDATPVAAQLSDGDGIRPAFDNGYRFTPTSAQVAASKLRNEESQRKCAAFTEWASSMRAAGRVLPSDSGSKFETLHSDDIRPVSPTRAELIMAKIDSLEKQRAAQN
jgi:hypothetical protein